MLMDNNVVMARVSTVFSIHERERVRERLLDRARTDARIVAAAAVGSLAVDEGDDSSDLDLMFPVSDNDLSDVVESWTQFVIADVVAVYLFDLPSGPILYGVFLLPDGLEFDLSFVPASEFRPGGPKSSCCSGKLSSARRSRQPTRRSSSATPSTTCSMREPRSSVVAIGKPNIGSALCETTR
ncbi:MAG: hypothetical protein ACJ76P_10830 [Actinomycetota bacterium]